MTPQEQQLIQNVADKLKAAPTQAKDAEAEALINQQIGSQEDIVYKLTQAVLVQEMALKEMKSKNDFLEQQVAHFKQESERGTLSRMMGGKTPPPMPPQPVHQPSAFGSFMQTAASIAAGMVVGNLISDALFGDDAADMSAATDAAAEAAPEVAEAAPEAVETAATEEAGSSFLGGDSGFASEYTDAGTDSFADAGFGGGEDFGGFDDGGFDDFGGDEDI
ncbi:DUF2076 domain-containing protein [Ferrimonas senticii]|uniref:DUF2076 domain-containing protein n=1 Tax=Ferrimonas senticii TaxID=394566 RepID=UPI00041311BE|nr:DUF2076 family protein [Ferrimonas senticii]